METKHTKAQWTLENTTGHTLRVTAGAKGFVIAEVTSDCITHFIGNTDEALANAKLIAAAPDLLNACKTVLKCKTNQYGETPELSIDLRTIIENAIEKATE